MAEIVELEIDFWMADWEAPHLQKLTIIKNNSLTIRDLTTMLSDVCKHRRIRSLTIRGFDLHVVAKALTTSGQTFVWISSTALMVSATHQDIVITC